MFSSQGGSVNVGQFMSVAFLGVSNRYSFRSSSKEIPAIMHDSFRHDRLQYSLQF